MKTATNVGLREFDGNQSSNSVKRLMGIKKLDLSTEISGENIVANTRKHLITVLIWSEITDTTAPILPLRGAESAVIPSFVMNLFYRNMNL